MNRVRESEAEVTEIDNAHDTRFVTGDKSITSQREGDRGGKIKSTEERKAGRMCQVIKTVLWIGDLPVSSRTRPYG